MSQLKDTANIVVLYDLWQTNLMNGDPNSCATPYNGHGPSSPGRNVLYADGHVSNLTKSDDGPWGSSYDIKQLLTNWQWDSNPGDYPPGQY